MGMFILCLLTGYLGVHKFVEGKVGMGLLYLFTGGLFCIGWIVDCVKYYKAAKVKSEPVTVSPAVTPVVSSSPYTYLTFKVAGVTFKNGRKTRQAILRALRWGDEEIETVDLEPYEWEGKPAVHVKVNDQVIGDIPANTVETFYEYERLYKRDNIHCEVYGGNKLDDGSRGSYGSEVTVRYLRES